MSDLYVAILAFDKRAGCCVSSAADPVIFALADLAVCFCLYPKDCSSPIVSVDKLRKRPNPRALARELGKTAGSRGSHALSVLWKY